MRKFSRSLFMNLILFSASILLFTPAFAYSEETAKDPDHAVSEDQKENLKKYAAQKNIPNPAEMLLNTDPEPDLSTGFTELYNGKDLSGWIRRSGTASFKAEGDYISGLCDPTSKRNSFLCTVRNDYKNFIFTCEINMLVNSNSGIMIRARKRGEGDRESVYGPQAEMEGTNSKRGWSGGIYGEGCGGWFYPLWLNAHQDVRKSIKKETWNRITVQAKGDEIKTWFNGLPAASWKNKEYQEGFLGLQVHAGKEGLLHFRNIKIKEL
ncbi:MAG: DUF1080 domain-containing protein [Planctomycetia bacterium]|nr:DUF1080 domain-containing protein [Planctomycetia bacterium]